MTIKQLKNKIEKMDDNLTVILSSDSEGNSFNILNDLSLASYKEKDYSLEIDEVNEFKKKCVIFYP